MVVAGCSEVDFFMRDVMLTVGLVTPHGGVEYSASEKFNGCSYDPRPVDIWVLAVLCCRMVIDIVLWRAFRTNNESTGGFARPICHARPVYSKSQKTKGRDDSTVELGCMDEKILIDKTVEATSNFCRRRHTFLFVECLCISLGRGQSGLRSGGTIGFDVSNVRLIRTEPRL